jgi:hypothetical protein
VAAGLGNDARAGPLLRSIVSIVAFRASQCLRACQQVGHEHPYHQDMLHCTMHIIVHAVSLVCKKTICKELELALAGARRTAT